MAAYAYAKALSGVYDEFNGYLVGKNRLVFTWAQGYLLQYKEPGDIKPEWLRWNWEQLPIVLNEIPLEPIPSQIKQLEVIKELCNKSKIIINGMDAAGAGEEIFRQLIDYLNIKNKPIKRLWTSSLQPSAIKKAFNQLQDHSDFDNLAASANVRSKLDYLLGINSTRSLTLVNNNELLPMGRLIGSVLALVKKREIEQKEFVKESYFAVKGFFQYMEHLIEADYAGPRISTNDGLKDLEKLMQIEEPIMQFEDKVRETFAPLLPNHTAVLVTMFQRYKMKPIQTTKVLESLYLKGMISYPRTNSCYVTEHDIPSMKEAYSILRVFYPNLAKDSDIKRFNSGNKRIVNDIDDHHAIIPTSEFQMLENEAEKNVYQFILERFMLQAQAPVKSKVRKFTFKYKDNKTVFTSSEKIILNPGWKGLELNFSHDELNDDELSEDELTVPEFKNIEGNKPYKYLEHTVNTRKTNPPSSYTEGSLIKQMENISSTLSNDNYKKILKKVGLGTSATRAETVKKLQDIEYLALEKNKLFVTELGERALNLINETPLISRICSVEMTAQLEQSLEAIRNGSSTEPIYNQTLEYIQQFINHFKQTESTSQVKQQDNETPCTICNKGYIASTAKTYKCTCCDFFIWKNQFNKRITRHMLQDILLKGQTSLLTFTNKSNNKYKARLKMSNKPGNLEIDFSK